MGTSPVVSSIAQHPTLLIIISPPCLPIPLISYIYVTIRSSDSSSQSVTRNMNITASKRKSRSSHDAYSKNLRLPSRYQSPWPGCFKKAKWQLGDVFSKGYRKMDKYFPTCSVVETIPLRRLRKLSKTPEQMDQSSVSRLHLGIV